LKHISFVYKLLISSLSKVRVFAEKANCALRRAVKLAGKTETFYQAEAPWRARKAAVKPGWRFGACLIKCKVSRCQLQQDF